MYAPRLAALGDGSYEQRFAAGYVVAEPYDESVLLGFTEESRNSIHSLLIMVPASAAFTPDEVYLEFNDQGNACSGNDVALTLTPETFEVEFHPGAELATGRISYEARADPLTDPEDEYGFPLRRLVVEIALTAEMKASLVTELDRLRLAGVKTSVRGPS